MRLFVGLGMNETARDALATVSSTLQASIPARYVPPELYHITLAYLGERGEDRIPAMQALLGKVAATSSTFYLTLSRLSWFGEASDAILYAELVPSNTLSALSMALRESLTQAGEKFDPKPLVPHITLARKAVLPDGTTLAMPPSATFQCGALTLFHSTRLDGVLRYLPIFEAPFLRE